MIAEPYLCFAACVQVAAKKVVAAEIDQVAIANQLGVVVPVDFDCSALTASGVVNIRRDSDPGLWGIEPAVAEINLTLKSASLQCSFEAISKFHDWEFEDRLTELVERGRFPIVGFSYDSLFGGLAQAELGHCTVVMQIRHINGQCVVEIYDPGPRQAGVQAVDCYSLYRACRKKRGGIWIISPL